MEERLIEIILISLAGVSQREWDIIKTHIDREFKRLSKKNTIADVNHVLKNIMNDVDF